jgi:hypothetical protein
MTAVLTDELKKRAYDLAVDLDVEIYTYPPEGGTGCTSWRYGMRGSADQYAKTFDSAQDAAVHFLTTREGQRALVVRAERDTALMAECIEALHRS